MTRSLPKDVVNPHVELGAPHKHSRLPACSPSYPGVTECAFPQLQTPPGQAMTRRGEASSRRASPLLISSSYPHLSPPQATSLISQLRIQLHLKSLFLAAALSWVRAGPVSPGVAFRIAEHHNTVPLERRTCSLSQN